MVAPDRDLVDDVAMRISTFASIMGCLAAFVNAGCGGSSGGTCSNTAGCGGDVVGTWTITSSCVSASSSMTSDSSCPTATTSGSAFNVRGTITYNADGTYSVNATIGGTVNVYLPASCLTTNGVTVTCDQLNQEFASNPTAGITVICSGSSGCTCVETVADQPSSETGTYTTTSAGVVTTTAADGTASQADYCVKGTKMTQSPHAGSTMMGAVESGTLTLTKS
jgi:hypothetical protein